MHNSIFTFKAFHRHVMFKFQLAALLQLKFFLTLFLCPILDTCNVMCILQQLFEKIKWFHNNCLTLAPFSNV